MTPETKPVSKSRREGSSEGRAQQERCLEEGQRSKDERCVGNSDTPVRDAALVSSCLAPGRISGPATEMAEIRERTSAWKSPSENIVRISLSGDDNGRQRAVRVRKTKSVTNGAQRQSPITTSATLTIISTVYIFRTYDQKGPTYAVEEEGDLHPPLVALAKFKIPTHISKTEKVRSKG